MNGKYEPRGVGEFIMAVHNQYTDLYTVHIVSSV